MPGEVGNPNHDPKTGRFTSASGLNKNNSTVFQRGGGKLRETRSAAKKFAIAAGVAVLGGVGAAILQGATRPVRSAAHRAVGTALAVSSAKVQETGAVYGPVMGMAINRALSKAPRVEKAVKKVAAFHQEASSNIPRNQYRAANISSVRKLMAANKAPSALGDHARNMKNIGASQSRAATPPRAVPARSASRPNRGPRLGQSRPRPR